MWYSGRPRRKLAPYPRPAWSNACSRFGNAIDSEALPRVMLKSPTTTSGGSDATWSRILLAALATVARERLGSDGMSTT